VGGAGRAGGQAARAVPGRITARLQACEELLIDDDTAARLCAMSAATIDRRLAAARWSSDTTPPRPPASGCWPTRVPKKIKIGLARQYTTLNPAQLRRDILTLSDRLLKVTRTKHQPARLPVQPPAAKWAFTSEATKTRSRAS
jgi:hypothetical protein